MTYFIRNVSGDFQSIDLINDETPREIMEKLKLDCRGFLMFQNLKLDKETPVSEQGILQDDVVDYIFIDYIVSLDGNNCNLSECVNDGDSLSKILIENNKFFVDNIDKIHFIDRYFSKENVELLLIDIFSTDSSDILKIILGEYQICKNVISNIMMKAYGDLFEYVISSEKCFELLCDLPCLFCEKMAYEYMHLRLEKCENHETSILKMSKFLTLTDYENSLITAPLIHYGKYDMFKFFAEKTKTFKFKTSNLIIACASDKLQIIEYAIEKEFDFDIKNSEGLNIFVMSAIMGKSMKILQKFIDINLIDDNSKYLEKYIEFNGNE